MNVPNIDQSLDPWGAIGLPFLRLEYRYQDELDGGSGFLGWDGAQWTERHTCPAFVGREKTEATEGS